MRAQAVRPEITQRNLIFQSLKRMQQAEAIRGIAGELEFELVKILEDVPGPGRAAYKVRDARQRDVLYFDPAPVVIEDQEPQSKEVNDAVGMSHSSGCNARIAGQNCRVQVPLPQEQEAGVAAETERSNHHVVSPERGRADHLV